MCVCALLNLRAQTCALALAFISVVLGLTLTSGCVGVSAQHQQPKTGFHPPKGMEGRVVGGVVSRSHQFPYLIAIKDTLAMSVFCGGSLLTESLVITAAHCLVEHGTTDQPKDLSSIAPIAGEHNMEVKEGQEQYGYIKRAAIHKNFSYKTFLNDVALIELEKPYTLKKGVVEIIQLATSTTKYRESNCTAAGWGQTVKQTAKEQQNESFAADADDSTPDTPLFVQLDIIKKEKCKALYKGVKDLYIQADHPSMICAGKLAGGKDTCVGDSGGPLACQSTSAGSEKSLLAGVVSNGPGCGMKNSPALYTDVTFMEPWLKKARKALAEAPPNTQPDHPQVLRV